MAFPTSPANGALAIVNGINYQYSSAANAWLRVAPNIDSLTVNNITATGNVITSNIYSSSYFWANGTPFASSNYGNTQVAAYLTGNVTVGNIITTNGVFWANGTAYSSGGGGSGTGITYTAGTTPPVSGNIKGDQWFNTTTNVLYEYLYDGTNYYWVDIVGPAGSFVSTGYVSRIYTTNGVNNTYTVSTGCAVTNILVFLNGVAQTPTTDYTISGDILTLVEVPAADQILQIRELPR